MFRKVDLAGKISGRLYLHIMPGRREPLKNAWSEITHEGISTLVCLTPLDEIRQKSPHYANAIERDVVPCNHRFFVIEDY